MSYSINLGIEKVDTDKNIIICHGQKLTIKYFDECVIVPMLNSMKATESVGVLKQLYDAGLPVACYNQHAHALNDYIRAEYDRKQREAHEAAIQAQRMADMSATPEEIAKHNAEREANRQAEIRRARSVVGGAGGYF